MAIVSNLKTHPVSWLMTQNKRNRLNKNISIQRKEVWDLEKKSNLIISLLMDVPIESLLFEETDDKTYNLLDGKQRTLTLCSFAEDGFALSPKIRIKEIDGSPIERKKFSELSEDLQNHIKDYQLSIAIMNQLNEDERSAVFFMRNQAVPLTKMDLSPVMLGEVAMKEFDGLCQHSFITGKVKLSPASLRKRDDLKLFLQYLILDLSKDSGFSGVEMMSICDDIKHSDISVNLAEIRDVLDYMNDAVESKCSYFKMVNMPIVLYVAKTAKSKGIAAADYGKLLEDFFLKAYSHKDCDYMRACQAGSAKKTNVQTRLRILSGILD